MTETATFAGGCFWCTEAVFSGLKGVLKVTPGYSGGTKDNPTYEEVSSGHTGHAESVQLEFDPKIISFGELLEVFFKLHDPTQLNRQGADVGTQYRSVIFYNSEDQKIKAEELKELTQKDYDDKVVTEVMPLKNFFEADPSHKEYYFMHRKSPYCTLVIDPKIDKLKKEFGSMLRKEN